MGKSRGVKYEEVIAWDNLCAAWEEFIRGKRNRKDVQEFMSSLGDELVRLQSDLAGGEYRHGGYIHFTLNDPKPRSIHKATVRDRLLHHALHRQLYPHFSSSFIGDSFSCQTGKGVHRALDRFRTMARKVSRNGTKTCWILKCDVRKFFASIDHDVLLAILDRDIHDARLRELLETVVCSFAAAPGKGLPLGNLTSQLFANTYMNEFDHFVKRILRAKSYIRYADDFVLLSHNRAELERHLSHIAWFLGERLALTLHPKKVELRTLASGVDFLGWVHFSHHRVPRTKTKRRAVQRLRQTSSEAVLQSYLGLFSHGDAHELRQRLMNDFWFWRLSTHAR